MLDREREGKREGGREREALIKHGPCEGWIGRNRGARDKATDCAIVREGRNRGEGA